MKQPAVFLDRDGTIIEDTHYISDPRDVKLLPTVSQGLRLMREKGYFLFVVSNQSGVGRGLISDEQFWAVHSRFCELLKAENLMIDEFAYCFHHPDDPCLCRKPKPGLIQQLCQKHDLDLGRSFAVGDKLSDLLLGAAVGAASYLVRTGKGAETERSIRRDALLPAAKVCADILEVAQDLPCVTA